jgi:hypothetical protein
MPFDPQYDIVTSVSGNLGTEVTSITSSVDGSGVYNTDAVKIWGNPVASGIPGEGEAFIFNTITQTWEIKGVVTLENGGEIDAPITMGSGGDIFFGDNIVSGTGDIYASNFYGTFHGTFEGAIPGDIHVAFAAYDKEYYKFSDSSSWVEATVIVFRGTDTLGTPTAAKIVAKLKDNIDTAGQVRIYDITNNNQIAIWNGVDSNSDEIYTTTVTNLPSTEAMFSVQGKKGSSYTYLRSLAIVF